MRCARQGALVEAGGPEHVRQQLGVPVRGGDMVQPWFRGRETFPVLGELTLRYPVTVDIGCLDALKDMQLVMETPEPAGTGLSITNT